MSPRDLERGSIVTMAATGVYSGKPRPAVVVQARQWLQAHPSITLCPLTCMPWIRRSGAGWG